MTAAAQTTPVVTNEIRDRWSRWVLRTCVFHAYLHGIIDSHAEGDKDLQVLPAALHEVVFTQCQSLIDEYSHKDAAGCDRQRSAQDINGALWDFLKPWRRQDVIDRRFSVPRDTVSPTNQLNIGE